MATDLSLIVDDASFSPASKMTSNQQIQLYKGSSLYSFDGIGSFTFSFEGASVAFTGFMPNSLDLQPPTVQIDNGMVFNITYAYPGTSHVYYQWFQSPVLSDGSHTVEVACQEGTYVDFAIVRVNVEHETRLAQAGTTIIVDSDSPSIIYSGNWSRSTDPVNGTTGVLYPYGNSTYSSSTLGDTFTFRFTGTSCAVYGVSRNQVNATGPLDMTYTIDGTTTNFTHYSDQKDDIPNYRYYSSDISAGDHTLIVNITAARGQTFTLDYVTYTPSFGYLTSTLSSSTPPVSSTLGGQVQTPSKSQPSPTAAIVGGVIGVASLVTILGLWLFLRRRRVNRLEIENTSQYVYTPDGSNQSGANHPHTVKQQLLHHEFRQPVKFGRFDPAIQATDTHLLPGPSSGPPPNTDNLDAAAEDTINPPPYDALSWAHPVQHNTAEDV